MRLRDNVWGGIQGRRYAGSGAIIFMLRMVLLRYLNALVQPYDIIVLTRTDQLYMCEHPHVVPNFKELCFPKTAQKTASGFTDRHHIFRFRDRALMLSVYPWLLKNDNEKLQNPEEVMRAYFKENGVSTRSVRRVMLGVRTPADTGRWNMSLGRTRLQSWNDTLFIKYKTEKNSVRCT